MSHNLRKNLKKLRQIRPDYNWKVSNRAFLLNEILKETPINRVVNNQKFKFSDLVKLLTRDFSLKLVTRPVLASFLVAGLVLGGGITSVGASWDSLPGDTLYSVKRTYEKAQVVLTIDKYKKAELGVNLVKKRVDELRQIKQNDQSKSKKIEKINLAAGEIRREVKITKDNLNKIKSDKEIARVVRVAKVIDVEVNKIKKTLKEQKENIDQEIIEKTKEKIDQALDAIKEAGVEAAVIIVEKHVSGEAGISEEEVVELINTKIESTKQELESAKEKVEVLAETAKNVEIFAEEPVEKSDDDETNSAESAEKADQFEETPELKGEAGEFDEAEKSLTEVENLMENKDFGTALSKITEVEKLIEEAGEKSEKVPTAEEASPSESDDQLPTE
ncbi:MAG TPA: DUF5667 domain-containing protein [Patescibacteria group bacterium]